MGAGELELPGVGGKDSDGELLGDVATGLGVSTVGVLGTFEGLRDDVGNIVTVGDAFGVIAGVPVGLPG